MNKITIIKAKDEDELVKKMSTATFFASQPMQKKDGTWICFLYSKEKEETATPEIGNIDEPATERQLKYLEVLKVRIPKSLTKKEASQLIEENKQTI